MAPLGGGGLWHQKQANKQTLKVLEDVPYSRKFITHNISPYFTMYSTEQVRKEYAA